MRHLGLVQWRYKGDRATALRYVPEARKYLGVYLNLLAAGGVQTGARTLDHKLAQGVVFRVIASFNNVPIVEIDTTGVTAEAQEQTLQGFVVHPYPAPDGFVDVDTWVVLDPTRTKWGAFFYDVSIVPTGVDFRTGAYDVDSNSKPLFQDGTVHADPDTGDPIPPHMDGLQNFGNVDWRNQDESLIVSWIGPIARYSGSEQASRYVFIHGQIVFDCSVLADGGFFGSTADYAEDFAGRHGVITGACLERNGSTMLCFVRFGTHNVHGGTTQPLRREYLIRLQLATDDPRAVPLPRAGVWKLRPKATEDGYDGNPVILWTHEFDDTLNSNDDFLHPWFFNQSATEARCIRNVGALGDITGKVENIVHVNDDDTVDFTTTDHDLVAQTSSGTDSNFDEISDGSVTPSGMLGGFTDQYGTCHSDLDGLHGDDFVGGGDYVDADPTFKYTPSTLDARTSPLPDGCWQGFASAQHHDSSLTNDGDPWVIAFVDYRDDVPVYAYSRMTEFARTDFNSVPSITGSEVHVVSSSGTYPGVVTISNEQTIDFAVEVAGGTDLTGVTSGFKTDWKTIEAEHTINTRFSASNSYHAVHSGSVHTSVLAPIGGMPGFCQVIDYVEGSNTTTAEWTGQGDYASTEVTEQFNLMYVDLRYRWLVYHITNQTISTNSSMPLTTADATDSLPDPVALTPTKVYGTVSDYYVTLGDEELAHTTVQTIPEATLDGTDSGLPDTFYYLAGDFAWYSWPCITQFFDGGTRPGTAFTPAPTDTSGGGCALGDTDPVTTTLDPVTRDGSYGLGPDPSSGWATTSVGVGVAPFTASMDLYGAWQTYKGKWLYSQAMPDGDDPTAPNYSVRGKTEQVLSELVNTPDLLKLHPIWVLPKIRY